MKMKIYLQPSSRAGKKFMVTIIDGEGRRSKIHFGAKGYSDYTKHKEHERMLKYLNRHRSREDWTKSGIKTAGFWARWILWNKPSLTDSIKNTEKRFKIRIVRGSPPKSSKKLAKSRRRSSRKRKSRKKSIQK